ncbi:MAG TPA: hypothetical protein VIS54_06660 [Psychromonas sp.]
MDNWPVPREVIRKGNFPYKFKIVDDYSYPSGWVLENPFVSEWLEISASGQITVKANKDGYSWDGCTPKMSVLNLFIFGTPDGHIDYRTMQPYTYHASLVHDALYQYLDSLPVSKEKIDLLFLEMLGDFKLRKVYHFFTKHFGGRGVIQLGI